MCVVWQLRAVELPVRHLDAAHHQGGQRGAHGGVLGAQPAGHQHRLHLQVDRRWATTIHTNEPRRNTLLHTAERRAEATFYPRSQRNVTYHRHALPSESIDS